MNGLGSARTGSGNKLPRTEPPYGANLVSSDSVVRRPEAMRSMLDLARTR